MPEDFSAETYLRTARLVALILLAMALLAPSVRAQVTITDLSVPSSQYFKLPSPDQPYKEMSDVPITVFATTGASGVNVKVPVFVNGQPLVTEVNNKTTPVTVTVAMGANQSQNFTSVIALSVGRQIMYLPLMQPTDHIDYTIKLGDVEKTVAVYAYPDLSGFFIIADILVAVIMVWFYRRVVKT